jgi:hypothetical protein
MIINNVKNTMPHKPSKERCFIDIRPINISITLTINIISAVERLAGRISVHIMPTGIITGRKAFLKSLISSCFMARVLAIYMINAILAKSDVCIVSPMPGIVSQRDAEFKDVPMANVNNSNGTEI